MRLNKLNSNSTIGIFSPSWPASFTYPNRYKRAYDYLSKKGFKLIEGNLTYKSQGYISGSTAERAEEFNNLISQCDCLIPTIGGYNSNGILSLINYDLLKQHTPLILGYSDTTAISLAVYAQTGIPTFISQALVPNFGEYSPFQDINYRYFSQLLMENQVSEIFELPMHDYWTDEWSNWEKYEKPKVKKENAWTFLKPGKVEGVLIGGNLDTICSIIGTPYMPEIHSNTILLLEDTSKSMDQIERSLSTLQLHGYFEKICGVIFSKFENINTSSSNKTVDELILQFVGDKGIPVLTNFDCGHTHPSCLLPVGGKISIDSEKKHIKVFIKDLFKM